MVTNSLHAEITLASLASPSESDAILSPVALDVTQAILDNVQKAVDKKQQKIPGFKTKGRIQSENPCLVKYRIALWGKLYYWTGRGRIPKAFKVYLSLGNALDDAVLPTQHQFKNYRRILHAPFPIKHREEAEALIALYDANSKNKTREVAASHEHAKSTCLNSDGN